jgi:hypothetical protein
LLDARQQNQLVSMMAALNKPPRLRRAPAFWSQKLSAGAYVVRSRFRLIRSDFEQPRMPGSPDETNKSK